jgi:hypothetical protein
MTVEIYRTAHDGFGWLLFDSDRCVGSSEIGALSPQRGRRSQALGQEVRLQRG